MGKKIILEACVDSLEAALAAEKAGADRIELCTALELGGLTPSRGMIEAVCEELTIPVCVLVRPRAGNFTYSPAEFETMRRDVRDLKSMGAAGVVSGCLTADFQLDLDRTQELHQTGNLPFTFHRAFDHCRSAFSAAEALAGLGVDRILTSGGESYALFGGKKIFELVRNYGEDISFMICGGLAPDNILQIATMTPATEFHFSAIQKVEETHPDTVPNLGKAGPENYHYIPDPEKVAAIRAAINHIAI